MKTRKSIRSDSLNSRLAAYSATAVAALVVSPSAEAAIQNITTFSLNGGASYSTTPPDLIGAINGAGTVLHFIGGTAGNQSAFKGYFEVNLGENGVYSTGILRMGNQANQLANHAFSAMASKLALGASIKNRNFGGANADRTLASRTVKTSSHFSRGDFLPHGANAAVTGYVGFKTVLHGKTYSGWLRVKVQDDGNGIPAEVSLVAKTGNPTVFGGFGLAGAGGDNITAGQSAAAPEPSSMAIGGLGLLALGARGVREMRRRRKQESK